VPSFYKIISFHLILVLTPIRIDRRIYFLMFFVRFLPVKINTGRFTRIYANQKRLNTRKIDEKNNIKREQAKSQ
jgi:hypothetical protein